MALADPQPGIVRLIIDFDPANGHINITGPSDNMPLMLGMMETAKFVVMQERIKAAQIAAAPKILSLAPDLDIGTLIRH